MCFIYVDDIFVAGSSVEVANRVIDLFKESFSIRVLENIEWFINYFLM